jgi:predicted esterase
MTGHEPQLVLVATAVHGRTLVAGGRGPDSPLLVGFHGYGENAERHLEELRAIPGADRWTIAAVQALHPFYNKSNEVIASWMTRLDREAAIEDNVAYVAAVVERLRAERLAGERLVFVGFSQGAAMAWRAAARSVWRCDGVVAVGGDVPPELGGLDLSRIGGALIGRGSVDSWYSAEKVAADLDLLRGRGVALGGATDNGGNDWTAALRDAIGEFLAARAG